LGSGSAGGARKKMTEEGFAKLFGGRTQFLLGKERSCGPKNWGKIKERRRGNINTR